MNTFRFRAIPAGLKLTIMAFSGPQGGLKSQVGQLSLREEVWEEFRGLFEGPQAQLEEMLSFLEAGLLELCPEDHCTLCGAHRDDVHECGCRAGLYASAMQRLARCLARMRESLVLEDN